jgi:hypothetical protein
MQISPDFPDFREIPVPSDLFLRKIGCDGEDVWQKVMASRAFRGPIQPFGTAADANAVARMLKASAPVDVHGGYLLPDHRAETLSPVAIDPSRFDLAAVFDVLVLYFEHSPDPWAFAISPNISRSTMPRHPHLRGDRKLIWDGQVAHGLCIYSAAEYSLDRETSSIATFLRQVSIFLGKTLLWLASPGRTWLGDVALSGNAHLSLDINGPCWCGDGKTYRDCCLAGEMIRFLRGVQGITLPRGLKLEF